MTIQTCVSVCVRLIKQLAAHHRSIRTSPISFFFIVCCSPSVHRPSIFKMDAFVTATTPAFVYWPFYLFCFVCFRPLHLYIYLKRHIKNKEKKVGRGKQDKRSPRQLKGHPKEKKKKIEIDTHAGQQKETVFGARSLLFGR